MRNKFSIEGNLGQDPKSFGSGSGVSVRVAADVPVRTGKEWNMTSVWYDVTAWGRIGEKLAKCRRGSRVIIDGDFSLNKYTDNNGQEQVTKCINATDVMEIPLHRELKKQQGDTSATQSNDDDDLPY